jgi:S1-C subfamily serine protease
METEIAQKHDELLYTVVGISCKSGNGSGVVISSGEYTTILTAKHVIGRCKNAQVTFYPSGESFPVIASNKSKDYDLAVLIVKHTHPYVATLSGNREVPVFTEVFKVGGGLSLKPFPGVGIVTGHGNNMFQLSSDVIYGDSGGGAFILESMEYRLIGINIAVAKAYPDHPMPHIGFAHDLDSILDFLSTL